MTPSFWPEASASACALRPFDLDRRHGDEQGAREVAGAAGAAWPTASSAASIASRSESIGAQKGSTATKSTVPAMVVRSASVGKR